MTYESLNYELYSNEGEKLFDVEMKVEGGHKALKTARGHISR